METPRVWGNMEERGSGNQAPTSSKASSFFIENLLGRRGSGQEMEPSGHRRVSGAEVVARGSCLAARPPYGEPWGRSGTGANLAALETSESE